MGVRVMDKSDLDFAVKLTIEEKWFYTVTELERMRELDPEGSFVFERGGERLGFATTVTYGSTGFLGHLIVSSHARGRRIGETLVGAAVEYMKRAGVESMMLYASGALKLYESYGFKSRMMALAAHSRYDGVRPKRANKDCSPLRTKDLPEVISLDAEIFGDDRTRLYEILYRDHPDMAFKIDRGKGIEGFIFGRPNHEGYDLGPWVCTSGDPADADALFRKEISTMNRGTVYSGLLESNSHAARTIDSIEKVRIWEVPLMIRGEDRYIGDISALYAVPAMELG